MYPGRMPFVEGCALDAVSTNAADVAVCLNMAGAQIVVRISARCRVGCRSQVEG